MSTILVTGGSGFIGSHVIDALLEAGHEVRNYDRRPSPYHGREVETVVGELADDAALAAAMKGCAAVVHLAAAADVGIVEQDPRGSEEANSRGTLAVLEAARSTAVDRVIYGSTIWVYGESEDDPVTEATSLGLPKHLYTASKLAGEMYCSSYAELYGVESTILRFGIPYGPRARPATVIPIFVAKALAGEPLTLAGDGMQSRRFVYVEDLAEGVVRALRPEAANRVYNLAGTETVTIKELAETVQAHVGEVEIVHTPGRNGDFGGAEVSSARAAEELGWSASTRLDEGVGRYLTWLRQRDAPELEPEPALADEESAREGGVEVGVVFACAALGTVIAWLISARFRLGGADLHAVELTTLAGSLLAIALIPAGSLRIRHAAAAATIAVLYALLLAIPGTRHRLDLTAPDIGEALISIVGVAIAMSTFIVARRHRGGGEETAPEHAT